MSVRDDQLDTLKVDGKDYDYYRIADLPGIDHLPYSLKVLVENLVRNIDGANITDDHVKALLDWDPAAQPSHEIQFTPSRVVMQDFTGVPCIVDLATMRDAVKELGGDPEVINPQVQSDMVIDHSVQIDKYGVADAVEQNMDIEYQRNGERYQFLRWGQQAFKNFRVVPPGTGIIHQVNIEYLAKVIMTAAAADGRELAYLDSCVGTDSHTTTVNGLGVLGWGVGGIEAEAAMLGQPISMLVPRVVGFKLTGSIPEGVTATDVVLTITDMLRKHGVVGKFVEFYGEGIASVPLANRATIGNMGPEFGSTCGIFPIQGQQAVGRHHRSELRGTAIFRIPRTRPRYGRAVHRRAEATSGPHRADRVQGQVRRDPAGLRDRQDRAGAGCRLHRLPWRLRHQER